MNATTTQLKQPKMEKQNKTVGQDDVHQLILIFSKPNCVER